MNKTRIAIRLEFAVGTAHAAVLDERFIDDLRRQFDLAGFFQSR